jgi:ankyrin repeat protein
VAGYKYKGYSQNFLQATTRLYLLLRFGLALLLRIILTVGYKDFLIKVDSKDTYSRTRLLWAAIGGHEAIVKLLVEIGKVDVDSKDTDS